VGRSQANSSLSGIYRRRMAIIHRTVRCAPDCPVSQRSAGPTAGRAICAGHVAEPTARRGIGLSGVHRTCPVRQRLSGCQRSTVPFMEGNRAPDSVRCAPDLDLSTGYPTRSTRSDPPEKNPTRAGWASVSGGFGPCFLTQRKIRVGLGPKFEPAG
jgi:hypothetical protein